MSKAKKTAENHMVEIWFAIEKDQDGYPESKDWEALLCSCLGSPDEFEVKSIPFYVKGVALGDIVSAVEAEEGYYKFGRMISRGGHTTYRLFVKKSPEVVEKELERLGCSVELTAGNKLVAVDAPPDRKHQIREYLFKGLRDGRWELQEASNLE